LIKKVGKVKQGYSQHGSLRPFDTSSLKVSCTLVVTIDINFNHFESMSIKINQILD